MKRPICPDCNQQVCYHCPDCKTPKRCNPDNGYCVECVCAKLLASVGVRCK